MVIWGTIQKDNENEDKQDNANSDYKKQIETIRSEFSNEQKNSDSINNSKIQKAIDSSYRKSIKASNEALAKYNLVLIDSLHTATTSINKRGPTAQLDLDAVDARGTEPVYISDFENQRFLNFRFISANATSYNIRTNVYFFNERKIDFPIVDFLIDQGGHQYLVPNRNRTLSLGLNPDVLKHDTLLVVMLGRFSRDDKGFDMIEFKTAFDFDFKTNKIVRFRPTINHARVREILNSRNIPN